MREFSGDSVFKYQSKASVTSCPDQCSLPASMLTAARTLSFSLAICASAFSGLALAEPPPPAYVACEKTPSDPDVSAAKGAYRAGQVSFEEADYDRALLYWEDAFRRDCTAEKLLLNIARAYELSGSKLAAVNALQTYVDRRPEAADRDSVEKRIARLQEKIDAEAAAAIVKEDPQVISDEPTAEEDAPPSDEASKGAKPVWPIILAGAGAVQAAAGHIIYAGRYNKARDLGCDIKSKTCPTDAATQEINGSSYKQAQAIGLTVAISGHVAGVAGGLLWYFLWTKDSPSSIATGPRPTLFQPVVAPGYQGFSLSGSF